MNLIIRADNWYQLNPEVESINPNQKEGSMKGRQCSNFKMLTVAIMVYFAAILAGCASTSQVQAAKDQADLALREAQAAKAMASDKNTEAIEAAKRAEMAADRAEAAARQAEDAAAKAEKIFMQKMKK
jgi:hypothetical protein